MGTLRTSEEGSVVAGEGRKSTESRDESRSVDEGAKIVIAAGPVAAAAETTSAPAPPVPRRTATPAMPVAPQKQGGLGLVITLYIVAAAALAYAIYERFFQH